MKRFNIGLFALVLALLGALPAAAQTIPNETPQLTPNCIYLPTPMPSPSVTTARVLRCAQDGTLQTSGGGGGGGGNVTIVGPLGTNNKAASVSITIASDQGAIPVSGTVSISGAVAVNTPAPAPTGAHGAVIVEGVASGTVVPISGTVTANAGSGTFTVSGTVTANAGTGNFSILPPLTGVSGTGTAQAVNQSIVADCAFNSSLPTITTGNVGPNQCDTAGRQIIVGAGTAGSAVGGVVTVQGVASGTNLNVAVGAALPAGGNTIGAVTQASGPWTVTPPLTGANGTGTAGAAAQALVASCNFTTAPATLTSGNVGPLTCDNKGGLILGAGSNTIGTVTANAGSGTFTVSGTVTATPPLTGANGTGTVGAAGQTVVAGCNFTTSPATLTSGNVGPVNCDSKGNQQVVGTGTAGSAAGGVLTVQGAASMTALAITPPLTGANGTGTAGAAAQAVVAACNFTTAPATLTTGNVGPLTCDSTGGLILGTGTKTIGAVTGSGNFSVTQPVTGANSTGTAGAAGQSVVASCNFTTSPATVTSGNVVPITCDNKGGIILGAGAAIIGIAKGPVTGANSTGTAGAVNQAMVASCNFTTSPATLTSGNVGPINCDSLGNVQIVGKGTVGTPSGGVLTVQGGSAGNVLTTSVSQWNGATLGSPGAVGVVGAANVLTVNSVNTASIVGGATKANFVNLAGTVQSIKSSAGTLYAVQVWNGTGATAFLQLFNVATGSVTLGTTVPDLQFVCPTLTYCFAPIPSTIGTDFATAISVASTTAVSGASGSASGVYLYAQYK